jgi:hypothetical protein
MPATATFNKSLIKDSVQELEARTPILVKELLESSARKEFKALKKKAGVYAFWWVGDSTVLKKEIK